MSAKEHIAIAVPSLDGRIPMPLAEFIAMATAENHNPDCPWGFTLIPIVRKQPFELPRNIAVREFLKTDASRLWFIDDDMIPYPGRSVQLLRGDADIVVGGYIRAGARTDNTIDLSVLLFEDAKNDRGEETFRSLPFSTRDDFFPIKSGGTGCMLIKRRVLEDPRMMYPTTYVDWRGIERDLFDEEDAPPPIFKTHRKPNGDTDIGEDHDFCRRAGLLGYSIHGHMLYGMDHQKTTTAEMILKTIAVEKVKTRQLVEGGAR